MKQLFRMNRKVFHILKNRNYLLLMIFSSLLIFIGFPAIQSMVTGSITNIDIWFKIISKLNLFLFAIFSISFGLMLSLQIYNLKQKVCDVRQKAVGTSAGGIGAMLALIVPACPACISLVSFILPASFGISLIQFINKFNTGVLLLSISLLWVGIYALGGLKEKV